MKSMKKLFEISTSPKTAGFYWVRLNSRTVTVGYRNVTSERYPWEVVGSDEIFEEREIEVIEKIDPPSGVIPSIRD